MAVQVPIIGLGVDFQVHATLIFILLLGLRTPIGNLLSLSASKLQETAEHNRNQREGNNRGGMIDIMHIVESQILNMNKENQ